MRRRPPRATRTDTLCPDTTRFRSIAPGNSEGEEIFYQFVIEQRIRPAIEQATTQPLAVAYSVMLLFSAGFYVVHGRTAKHIIIEAQCECRHAAARCLFVLGIISGSRSEEHTSEIQALMRISHAVLCFNKKK